MQAIVDAFKQPPEKGALQQICDDIWWLKMPLPFELDHINLYILESQHGLTLVDTGLGGGFSHRIWQRLFAGPLANKPVERVIVTHYHPDHLGAAGGLCEQHNVPLYISQPEYDCIMRQQKMATETGAAFEFLHQLGLPENVAARMIKANAGFAQMYDPLPTKFNVLAHGDQLQIGARNWQISLADGHSPGHATLFCAADALLISGDQVLPRISSNVSVRADAPEANPLAGWLQGLDRLLHLPADTLVLPAHDNPFYGLHTRLNELTRGHHRLLDQLLNACSDTPQTVLQLAPKLYKRELHGFHLLMALGECKAHLRFLARQGQLHCDLNPDGQFIYSARQA